MLQWADYTDQYSGWNTISTAWYWGCQHVIMACSSEVYKWRRDRHRWVQRSTIIWLLMRKWRWKDSVLRTPCRYIMRRPHPSGTLKYGGRIRDGSSKLRTVMLRTLWSKKYWCMRPGSGLSTKDVNINFCENVSFRAVVIPKSSPVQVRSWGRLISLPTSKTELLCK